jgi:hypothetical protein
MTHGELDTMINNADFNGILRKSLPAVISMQLAKIIRKCNDELIEFNMEKQKIIQQYSIKDKDGNPIIEQNGNVLIEEKFKKKAMDEIKIISSIPVDNSFILPKFGFNSESFPNMTTKEAMALLPFIKEN